MTLVELMVSMSVLLIAVALVLTVYDAIWRSFEKGENAAEQQQNVRIVMERMGQDLQMAGFNYNPDGDPNRPDEQFEAAYDTAVVMRADLDAADVVKSTNPETALAGGAFETVSTGNDEIVVYVLAKADGSSTDTLTFEADVKDEPRDAGLETVQIPNVALVHDDPPYTLYRITLSNDTASWGTPDFLVRDVLAYNIGALSFRYHDGAGSPVNSTFDLTSTADDIGGAETRLDDRSRIRSVEFELIGLARDPQPDWVDPADPNPATRSFHKFHLASNIRPRNLGVVGLRDNHFGGGSLGGP
jgi:hypothetical protein